MKWASRRLCQVLTSVRGQSSGPASLGGAGRPSHLKGTALILVLPFPPSPPSLVVPTAVWGVEGFLLTPLHHCVNNCPLNIVLQKPLRKVPLVVSTWDASGIVPFFPHPSTPKTKAGLLPVALLCPDQPEEGRQDTKGPRKELTHPGAVSLPLVNLKIPSATPLLV